MSGWTYLHFRPGAPWPASIPPDEGMSLAGDVAVFWPDRYTGTGLDGGELAVVDASGNVLAITGKAYRLKVQLPLRVAAGYPDASRSEGTQGCPGADAVIAE
jgi:hypothetical protein